MECLSGISKCEQPIKIIKKFRWGRASNGGFNKNVEKLATRMNSALPDDNELDEEEDVYGVAERLRSIREGKREAHFNP